VSKLRDEEDERARVLRILSDEVEGWRKMTQALLNENASLVHELRICWRRFERLARRVHVLEGEARNGNGAG